MSFKLDFDIKSIQSPILLKVGDKEYQYKNGANLAKAEFDRKYEITSIRAKNNTIEITATEKSLLPTENWTKKELSFF